MNEPTGGIHHVTAICDDPQRNVDFYAGVLGLRLVKRTVNFDDPQTYHLYYGDEIGRPGSLLTFFAWPGAARGRVGPGQVAVTSFAVVPDALGFWIERLLRHGVKYRGPTPRRGTGGTPERVLAFEDGDGLMLEIVAGPRANERLGWDGAPGVPAASALRGIHGVTVWEEDAAGTTAVLIDLLGFRGVADDDTTQRLATGDGGPGTIIDVRTVGGFPRGNVSVGTVHHVAWRVHDEPTEIETRERVLAAGLEPTPVIDRQYFHSVYFNEPGGVLFELATEAPGFMIDEPRDHLGEQLMLPPRYEPHRAQIEALLPPIYLATGAGVTPFSDETAP